MECSSCGKPYRGGDIISLGRLRVLRPDEATDYHGLPNGVMFRCGTICPRCGYANDAPGFAPGDDVPRQCADGELVVASRHIPPVRILPSPESLMGS